MVVETKKRKTSNESNEDESGQRQPVLVDQSLSVAGRPLPAAPGAKTKAGRIVITNANNNDDYSDSDKGGASIVLFYQYKEPVWTEHEFQKALKLFLSIGRRFSMTGRGRIAPEGVNCTLTGPSGAKVRGFCQALRDEWGVVGADGTSDANHSSKRAKGDKDLFQATDFKITDGLPQSQKFKSLSVRKTDELVAYGLEGEKAPSIEKFGGEHLTAVDYHEALKDKDTIVIDVRNAYETAIGTIVPPKGGATLLDPKLRNSREWPKWLASEETKKKLSGKKILTFCTGGIRCERATALINQMATVSKLESKSKSASIVGSSDEIAFSTTNESSGSSNDNHNTKDKAQDGKTFQPNGVYHMRGGIERYLKTYPQGGYWSGKNYLFDKRMEQLPELKDSSKVEAEVATTLNAKCCLCRKPWTTYRGQHKCGQIQCGVPVLVCDSCHISLTTTTSNSNQQQLRCELCREGYRAPQGNPDLVAMRKRAEKAILGTAAAAHQATRNDESTSFSEKEVHPERPPMKVVSDRLFLNRLPLTTKKSEIEEWLQTPIRQLHWVTDRGSGAFYGSCIVRIDIFSKILLAIKKHSKIKKGGKSSLNPRVANKTDENASGGPLREFLGSFPGTSVAATSINDDSFGRRGGTPASGKRQRTTQHPHRKQRRLQQHHQQQPKIFRVLAKPGEAWPPPDQNDAEYPPLGRIQ